MRVHQSFFSTCLRKSQYGKEAPFFQAGSTRALGTAYHAALEHYYLARKDDPGGMMPGAGDMIEVAVETFDKVAEGVPSHPSEESLDFVGMKWDEAVPDREFAVETLRSMIGDYMTNEWFWPDSWEVLEVELSFNLPWWMSHTRGGAADLILRDSSGWVTVCDQKTARRAWPKGKEHPRKNLQACWYVAAAKELFPDAAGHRACFDIMVWGQKGGNKFERRESFPSPAHIEATDTLMRDLVTTYEFYRMNGMDLPANPQDTLCNPKWCDYWEICPHGAALDAPQAVPVEIS